MKILSILLLMTNIYASDYNRKEWKHWIDEDKDCKNTRQEILEKQSLEPVTYRKSKRGFCSVKTGKWKDFYYDEFLYKASQIDVDHVVPLKHAHEAGGASWSKSKKKEFANDPENLVLTNLKYNRSKGAKSITEWLPISRTHACQYVKQWFYIKEKYQLSISEEEEQTKKLLNCP